MTSSAPGPPAPRARVRTATDRDVPILALLRFELRSELREAQEPKEAFVERCARWMAERLPADPRWRCWVAEHEGEIIGTVWLQTLEKLPNPVTELELHAYITSVYIAPHHRNAGAGALLLETALEWCRASGIDAVFLWPSARSRGLYQRHGFSVRDDLFALRPASGAAPPRET